MSTTPQPTVEADFVFAEHEPFRLAGGDALQPVTLHYALYGALNAQRDNAVLVCHALSGSARVADWWPQLFGADGVFDPAQQCIIGINILGSCYGSTGPTTINPAAGVRYGADFPLVTIKDIVRTQARLLDHLGVERLYAAVGGSIGGMQALQWAADFPARIARCIAIGAAPLSALALALNHLQRRAILSAATPADGLALARAIAMCSYKSAELFTARYGRRPNRNGEDPHRSLRERYDVAGYLDYQGALFTGRFDADSYLIISKAMDNFDLALGYESEAAALRRLRARVLLVGISSDWLFPAADVYALHERLQAAGGASQYAEVHSAHGHDGFLADAHELNAILRPVIVGD